MRKVLIALILMMAASAAAAQTPTDTLALTPNSAITQYYVAGGSITAGQIVQLSGSSTVIGNDTFQNVTIVPSTATSGVIGVAEQTVGVGTIVVVALIGQIGITPGILVDGACTAGQTLVNSSTTSGSSHCVTGSSTQEQVGFSFTTLGSAGLVAGNVAIGSSGGGGGGGGGLANPMTTYGDMITGGLAGTPTRVPAGLTRQVPVASFGAGVVFASLGIPAGNGGSAVTATPYTVLCDNGTTLRDRTTVLTFQSGAAVVNVPDPTTSGCQANFAFAIVDDGAGTLTINRTTSAVFNIANGSGNTDGATSFTLSNGQFATLNSPDNVNWTVRVVSSGGNVSGTSFTTSCIPKASGSLALVCSSLSDNGTIVSGTEPFINAGLIDGQAPVTVVTASTFNFGTTYSSGYWDNENATAGAAVTGTLPPAVQGKTYCLDNAYNGSTANTGVLTIQTSGSGQYIIWTDGTISASGGYIQSPGTARDSACVRGVDSTHWMAYIYSGTSWSKH